MKAHQTRPKNTIARQLIQKVSVFAVIVVILLTSIIGFISYCIEVNRFSRQLEDIEKSYLDVVRKALWIDDKETLTTVLIGICSLPGIQYADVHSKESVVCDSGRAGPDEKWIRIFPVMHAYKGEILQLGELHIQGDAGYLRSKIVNMVLFIALSQAVTIFLICCLILWIMHAKVIGRVLKITSYTTALSLENIDRPLLLGPEDKTPDELDALSDGINQTRERLYQAYIREKEVEEELKKSHDLLEITVAKRTEKLNETVRQLQDALAKVNMLSGLIPICSHCKKIRDDKGYWNILESYIQQHADVSFSHGLCPECSEDLYGNEGWYRDMKKKKEEGE